jgi:hypothetical protein
MLTADLDATYNDYVPYSGNGRLNENVADIYNKVEEHTEDISQINADLTEINSNLSELNTDFRKNAINNNYVAIRVGETFTAPNDGYVLVGSSTQAGSYAMVDINGILPIKVRTFSTLADNPPRVPVFVKKDMRITHDGGNLGLCYFFELK